MSAPFCPDCPDHEACSQGAPCDVVLGLDPESFSGTKANDVWLLVAALGWVAFTGWFVWEVFIR